MSKPKPKMSQEASPSLQPAIPSSLLSPVPGGFAATTKPQIAHKSTHTPHGTRSICIPQNNVHLLKINLHLLFVEFNCVEQTKTSPRRNVPAAKRLRRNVPRRNVLLRVS
ncbi:hypothetical protein L596_000524 [Steinernema carpocapsae]|uniref:Uncharacterized protein n=1 Tax=Steinernema carpocapsae TaxID=34508 RepID=A0A4U8UKR0_STECR|nr:hypothetical protein L596_000524 [Steinernema carpocapsae]